MVFEVNNTTEKLIGDLQFGVEETIKSLKNDQQEIKSIIERLDGSLTALSESDLRQISDSTSAIRKYLKIVISGEHLNDEVSKINHDNAAANAALEKALTAGMNKGFQNELDILSAADSKIGSLIDALDPRLDGLAKTAETNRAALTAIINEGLQNELDILTVMDSKIGSLIDALNSQLDGLVKTALKAFETAEANRETLSSIAAYLSLPGYKRFFKGMEVVNNETTE